MFRVADTSGSLPASEYGTPTLPLKSRSGVNVNDPSGVPTKAPELAAPNAAENPHVMSLMRTPDGPTTSGVLYGVNSESSTALGTHGPCGRWALDAACTATGAARAMVELMSVAAASDRSEILGRRRSWWEGA